MIYTLTRDVVANGPTLNENDVAFWPEEMFDDVLCDGMEFYDGVNPSGDYLVEMPYEKFREMYPNLDIQPGEKKKVEIIVHWVE